MRRLHHLALLIPTDLMLVMERRIVELIRHTDFSKAIANSGAEAGTRWAGRSGYGSSI